MNYPLIKKWLGLEVFENAMTTDYVFANQLESKLAEGFEVYGNDRSFVGGPAIIKLEWEKYIALAIGKQPIKKKTKEEKIADVLKDYTVDAQSALVKIREILEMK